MSHVYVLALTSRDFPNFTFDGHRIECIKAGNLYAALERRNEPPTLSEGELRSQHTIVMEIFARVDAILPVRFGTWIERRELLDVIERRRSAIADSLALVRGRVQMTVRFPHAAAPAADERSRVPRESGTTYLRMRRSALLSLPADVTAFKAAVTDLVVAERTAAKSDNSAFSLYHLIARDVVAEYRAAIEPFLNTVSVSGPWPPFAFAPDPWS